MATIICSHCSAIVTVEGPPPDVCPTCGKTLRIEGDETHTGGPLPSTVLQAPEQRPASFGRYIVLKRLGGGGFGSVFQARDPQLDCLVAIKVPRRDTGTTPQALERFAREGRSAAQLRHPGIVSVFNVGHDGELPYIVCEYVEGETLADRLRKGPIPFRAAAQIVADVADALEYAHAHNIIHRDIKPSNIMLCVDGKPRLMDFGLAKRDVDITVTAPHAIIGTPAYMSPEQAWGGKRGPVDERSDVYSLGTVLYHLLTGDFPFHGEPRMVMRQVIEDEPKAPRALDSDIPIYLEVICQKAMRKESGARYQSAGALAKDLQRWLDGRPIEARPATKLELALSWCRRNPAAAGLIATIALFLVAVAGGGGLLAAVEANARKKAEDLLTENRAMLSKSYVERAGRYLMPEGFQDTQSALKALPWLYAAMEVDETNPLRRDASHLRLESALAGSPAVEKLWWHGGRVYTAAFSHNGAHFFTGGWDGTGRLWDVSSAEARKPALIHPDLVTSAQFSPDDKLLLTGCQDGAVRLWDVASCQLVGGPIRDAEMAQASTAVRRGSAIHLRGAFSPTGKYFVTTRERSLQTYLTATAKPIGHALVYPGLWIAFADFSKDEKTLLIGAIDGSINTADVESGKLRQQLAPANKGLVTPSAISPDQTTIASVVTAKSIVLRHGQTGERITLPEMAEESDVRLLRFSHDGRSLATGTKDGTVSLWKTSDGTLIWRRRLLEDEIRSIQFGGSGDALLTAGSRRSAHVVDNASGNLAADPIILPEHIRFCQTLPHAEQLATATGDGVVRLWKLDADVSTVTLPNANNVLAAAVSADARVLASIDKDRLCCVLKIDEHGSFASAALKTFSVSVLQPVCVSLAGDGTKLAIADLDSHLTTYDLTQTPRQLARVETGGQVTAMAFSGDGTRITTFSKDGQAVWNVDSGERIRTEQTGAGASARLIDFVPKGDACVVANRERFDVLSPVTGTRIGPGVTQEGRINRAQISPDRRLVITHSVDQIVRVWDVTSGKLVAATPPMALFGAIAFSPDSTRFATGSVDGVVQVWRSSDASPITDPISCLLAVDQIRFSPSGRWVIAIAHDQRDLMRSSTVFGWDTFTGDRVFSLQVSRLARRGIMNPDAVVHQPSEVVALFFSWELDRVHVVTRAGLLASYDLWPDSRSKAQLLDEVALRSGTQPDSKGGLAAIAPEQLVARSQAKKPFSSSESRKSNN